MQYNCFLCYKKLEHKVIWFNKKADIRLIEKENREKVIISNKWNKIVKIFQNIN